MQIGTHDGILIKSDTILGIGVAEQEEIFTIEFLCSDGNVYVFDRILD